MRRSNSAQHQKHNKKEQKIAKKKQSKEKIQIKILKSPRAFESQLKTQRPQTCRSTFQQRLTKIRKGFQDLQKNLDINNLNSLSPLAGVQSEITSRKVARKLFHNQSTKKTVVKAKQNESDRFLKKPTNMNTSPSKGTPKNSKYHSCVYEKSLYDLMKIVIIQKDEILRLNSEIKVCKSRR